MTYKELTIKLKQFKKAVKKAPKEQLQTAKDLIKDFEDLALSSEGKTLKKSQVDEVNQLIDSLKLYVINIENLQQFDKKWN